MDLDARNKQRSFLDLKRPYINADFLNVIKILREIKANNEKIVIYGDYDADGITATAILKIAFDNFGLHTGFFIPNRYVEGYGLNNKRIDDFHHKGYKYILTVDNGITADKAIDYALSLGITTIVVDHHNCDNLAINTPYIFHQTLSNFLEENFLIHEFY